MLVPREIPARKNAQPARQPSGCLVPPRTHLLYWLSGRPMVISNQDRISKLRRWSAIVAIALVVLLVGVYLYRQRQERLARESLPPPVPESVGQRSAGFTFSKIDRGRTLFTIHASRVTEFKETKKSLLEDVSIVIFGSDGSRQDRVASSGCEYLAEQGEISCPGSVAITLESAKAAARTPPGKAAWREPFQITTSAIRFLEEPALGSTDQQVSFRFAGGHGRARGLVYRAREEILRLEHDVEVTAERREDGRKVPVTLRGSALEFRRSSNQARVLPPVQVHQAGPAGGGAGRRISADSLIVQFDARMRPVSVSTEGQVAGAAEEKGRTMSFRADRITASFVAGVPAQVAAEGSVLFESVGVRSRWQLGAGKLLGYFAKKGDRLERIEAEGDAKVTSAVASAGAGSPGSGEREQRLEAPGLRLLLQAGPKLESAETMGAGKLVMVDAKEQQVISGDVLRAKFGEKGQMQTLHAGPHARFETFDVAETKKLPRVATSNELTIEWDSSGREMLRVLQTGDFRFQQGEQSATSERAIYDLRKATIVLSGSPAVGDRASRTTAKQFAFFRDRDEIQAEGGVQTTYLAQPGGASLSLPGGSGPVKVNARRMRARAEDGWAQYEGRVRLWQGTDAVEADVMEVNLKPEARGLIATGDVRSVLGTLAKGKQAARGEPGIESPGRILRIHSARMKFVAKENLIRYEGSVEAVGDFGRLTSQALEIRLAASGAGRGGAVERILALGNVRIVQPGRRGKSERAEYFPSDGTIVLSGGTPTLEDDELGTVTGAALTFKNAGASISVESKEGKRTLSRHQLAP